MKNNIDQNIATDFEKKIAWDKLQKDFKEKFGVEIYESWLKKINFVNEYSNYVLLSVTTRFIRDWITSRYLDQIFQIVKSYKKEALRIEFIINDNSNKMENNEYPKPYKNDFSNVSFIKDSFLQYNQIDSSKSFENFIIGNSNKLAYEASKKITEDLSHYNPLYIYGGVGMGKTHLLNAIGLTLKKKI